MNNLFSIIIPTRNRQKYCLESVISILKEFNEKCNLVIQDNSSNNSLKIQIENLNDPRIIYNYNPIQLSFIDNFEEALNLSNAKYFCILGDDDSITKDIVQIVEWMDVNQIESLASTKVVDYIWPNDDIEKYKDGIISIPSYNGGIEFIDLEHNLKELVKDGFLFYQKYNLPRTYHGIIKRSAIDEVKKISGRYFDGLTPDIYSTVALSTVVKKHCVLDYPFSIAGACPASATVNATVGGHSGKLRDAPHFRNRGEYVWEKSVPEYYSVETIWAETAIKALKNMLRDDLLIYFNNYRLYIYGIFINRKYIFELSISKTLLVYKNLGVKQISHYFNLLKAVFKIGHKLFYKKLFIRKETNNSSLVFKNIATLEEAKIKIIINLKSLNLNGKN